jgi:hypothetical protein
MCGYLWKRRRRILRFVEEDNALMPTPLANDLELIVETVLVVAPRMLVQVCAFQEAIASLEGDHASVGDVLMVLRAAEATAKGRSARVRAQVKELVILERLRLDDSVIDLIARMIRKRFDDCAYGPWYMLASWCSPGGRDEYRERAAACGRLGLAACLEDSSIPVRCVFQAWGLVDNCIEELIANPTEWYDLLASAREAILGPPRPVNQLPPGGVEVDVDLDVHEPADEDDEAYQAECIATAFEEFMADRSGAGC